MLHNYYIRNCKIVIKLSVSKLLNRGVARGGSKGSDEPPFKPGRIFKIKLARLNDINLQLLNQLNTRVRVHL